MKFTALFLWGSTLQLMATALPHQPTDVEASRQYARPLPTEPMKWTGPAFLNGTEVTLHGNIQQVQGQLLNLNPNYEADFAKASSVSSLHTTLLPRNTEAFSDCHSNEYTTNIVPILSGINHLISTGGACHVKAGQCTNIYCSGSASMRLCNSNKVAIQPSCAYLATYAVRVLEQCSFTSGSKSLVGGSLWDTDQYLVDVTSNREGSC